MHLICGDFLFDAVKVQLNLVKLLFLKTLVQMDILKGWYLWILKARVKTLSYKCDILWYLFDFVMFIFLCTENCRLQFLSSTFSGITPLDFSYSNMSLPRSFIPTDMCQQLTFWSVAFPLNRKERYLYHNFCVCVIAIECSLRRNSSEILLCDKRLTEGIPNRCAEALEMCRGKLSHALWKIFQIYLFSNLCLGFTLSM